MATAFQLFGILASVAMALLVFRPVYDFGISANAGNIAALLIISALVSALGFVLEELRKIRELQQQILIQGGANEI